MISYWLLFFLPLTAVVLLPRSLAVDARKFGWMVMGVVAAIAIGLRHEVGADWERYLEIYDFISGEEFLSALAVTDPSYAAANWLSARLGWGIYGVNLLCGILFAAGVGAFCIRQPMPWLAWLVATPVLMVTVAMGYSRQGAALGLAFWSLAYLEEKRVWLFVLLVTLGATFHRSAALLLPFAFLAQDRTRWIQLLGLALVALLAGSVFLLEHFEPLWSTYIEAQMVAEGGPIRAWMNALPAAIMLAMNRRWTRRWPDPGHWRWLAWLAIGCVFLVGMASSAVDRVALYLLPLQIYVWSRIPLLFADRATRTAVVLGICLVYAAVLWVWLNFAINAPDWLPYKNILLPW